MGIVGTPGFDKQKGSCRVLVKQSMVGGGGDKVALVKGCLDFGVWQRGRVSHTSLQVQR